MVRVRTVFTGILTLLLAAVFSACGHDDSAVTIGTSEPSGGYYLMGTVLADVLKAEKIVSSCNVNATSGTAENIRLLSNDDVQIAFCQADTLLDAYERTGMFLDDSGGSHLRAVAGLYPEAVHIVVRSDSDIMSVSDLNGKNVSVGIQESGTEQNAFQILTACGLNPLDVTTLNMTTPEAADALISGEIDAFFVTAGYVNKAVEELCRKQSIRFVSLSDETVQNLNSEYGAYFRHVIPKGVYTGVEEDTATAAVKSVLVVRDTLPDETVQAITAAVFKHARELQDSVHFGFVLDEENAVSDITIPFHSGAAAYYQSKGIDVPSKEAE